MKRLEHAWVRLMTGAALLVPCASVLCQSEHDAQSAVFAVVDGAVISAREFDGALSAAVRQKFYHRRPPEEQLAELRVQVAERLIDRRLLLQEAQRRGIRADDERVSAELAALDERNQNRPQWQQNRGHMLPALKRSLQDGMLIEQLEATARAVSSPAEEELRAYYDSNQASFTEPERVRLSMILFSVDPSAPREAWDDAAAGAHAVVDQLASGADFAELARRYSSGGSAERGGDMGYLHRGMLPPGVDAEVDRLSPGDTSQPFRLLEGFAVFRLTERNPAQLRAFEEVRRSVTELWARAKGETQWREFIARLRASAQITISADGAPVHATRGDAGAVIAPR